MQHSKGDCLLSAKESLVEEVTPASLLIKLEDISELNKFRFAYDNILMWPLIRHRILWDCCKKLENIAFEQSPVLASNKKKVRQSLTHHLSLADIEGRLQCLPASEVLVVSAGRQQAEIEGQSWNKYIWPFASMVSTAALVDGETHNVGIQHVLPHELVFEYGRRFSGTEYQHTDLPKIERFIDYLREVFGQWLDESVFVSVKNQLTVISARLKFWHQAYLKIFEKVQPKLIVIGNASYGNRAFLIKWAKDVGIRVAEFQHAAIHKNLTPYQYSPATLQSGYVRDYLPDDFLMFGAHWQRIYRGGAIPRIIGNPYFQYRVESFRHQPKVFLVCINGFDNQFCVDYLRYLIKQYPQKKIRIRFHPSVFQLKDFYHQHLPKEVAYSSLNQDLFSDFKDAEVVIAEASTVIYESLSCAIPTYLIPTREWPKLSGLYEADRLLSVKDVADSVSVTEQGKSQYFGEQWQSKLNTYLQEMGLKTELNG